MTTKQTLLFCASLLALSSACDSDDDNAAVAYTLDREASSVEWHGAGPAAEHRGAFAVEEEGLRAEDGKITGGTFTIPIASITNFDLPEEVKPVLLNHLKTADFFNIAVHPTASFTITSVTAYTDEHDEHANAWVKGNFTLLGKTLPIEFPASMIFTADTFTTEALVTIDRTKWGMMYMADEATAGEHFIYHDVNLHLKLAGSKK